MALSDEERITRLKVVYERLATKADVENLRGDLNSGLSSVRRDIKCAISSAYADINRRVDRVFWAIIGIGGGLLAVAAAALVRDALA